MIKGNTPNTSTEVEATINGIKIKFYLFVSSSGRLYLSTQGYTILSLNSEGLSRDYLPNRLRLPRDDTSRLTMQNE